MFFLQKLLLALLILLINNVAWGQAAPSHGGHGGMGGSDDQSCIRAKISHVKPDHLATVSPESEFSFTVSGSNGPGHIHVSIRQEPVPVTVEDKDSFYLVKGKLPIQYKNDTVRLSIKVKAKVKQCDSDTGILLKITE